MKKFALVLSGGGFNGAFQIGALNYIKKNWDSLESSRPPLDFDIVAGVSVGSLNGALIASQQFDPLLDIWEKIRKNGVEEIYTSEFIDTASTSEKVVFKVDPSQLFQQFLPDFKPDISFWKILPLIFSKQKQRDFLAETLEEASGTFTSNFNNFKALADNHPLEKKLQALLKRSNVKDTLFRCGFVSLNSGAYHSIKASDFKTDNDFQQGVLASSAIPIVWKPIAEIKTNLGTFEQLIDGGIKNVSPLGDVLKDINQDPENEYTLIIINCNAHEPVPGNYNQANIAQIALRALTDLSLNEIFNNDIREYLRINDLLQQAGKDAVFYNYNYKQQKRTNQRLKAFKTIIIQPDSGALGDSLVSTKLLYDKRYFHGENKAIQAFNSLQKLGPQYQTILT